MYSTCPESPARASDIPSDPAKDEPETIMVVGSHIIGADKGIALPIEVLTPQQIAATGAVTGDDLMRTIASMGKVTFNSTNDQQTSNAARGDVASIDLRGSGLGDTLVLLDGRRIVEYPTSQTQGGVPLISYNAQALPVMGLQRVEVLRQGAAAIYGADAVAGVVNLVTRTDFDGATANIQYGFAEGTHLEQPTANILIGRNFDDRRGNVTLSASIFHSTAQLPSDEPYTASQDLRSLFAHDPAYNSSSAPDGRSNQSSYAALVARAPNGASLSTPILQGPVVLTTAAGSFHIQPNTLSGCITQIGNGLCYAKGPVPYSTTGNSLRYDADGSDSLTISPQINRQNFSLSAHYDVNSELTVYSDVQYYRARSHGLTTQPTALVPIGVPATNYYNPLGPVTFENGAANPNRLSNLTNVPTAGLPIAFSTYRFNDFGPDNVDVNSFQDRFLVGAKGTLWGFRYDSALLYGEARVEDISDAIDSTLLANQLALSTPDAYNPFNGGCLDGSGGRDCTPSAQAARDAVRFRLKRVSTTSLINLDYKLSKSDLLRLPAGNVGIAFGIEGRREAHSDERDPRVDGEVSFTDPVLLTSSASNAVGVNTTPSTSDSRSVASLFSELAIPIVSPDSGIALIRKVDLQLAARIEHYSDFGNVTRPKAALAWNIVRGVLARASWERGFKAPNLETMATYTYARAQTVTDWYRCQAALNKGIISNFNACSENYGIAYTESGNPNLHAESSRSYDFGLVLQPDFVSESIGALTFTIDRWHLRQTGIVGVVGADTFAVEDYLNRTKGGQGSANFLRAAPTADDIAFFSGSGLAPVGVPTVVSDGFNNLQPQTLAGVDLSLTWSKVTDALGAFAASIDATRLDLYSQSPSPELQALYSARAAGIINISTPLDNPGNQLQVLGNPKWKATSTLTWSGTHFQAGSSLIFTGSTLDTNFLSNAGVPWHVASLTTVNLYVQYGFSLGNAGSQFRIKVGARNLFDRSPPLESDGFNGGLYTPYGRYVYFNVSASL
jgi:iron complex outermembrane receptor protein